jgi:hypothetical protein
MVVIAYRIEPISLYLTLRFIPRELDRPLAPTVVCGVDTGGLHAGLFRHESPAGLESFVGRNTALRCRQEYVRGKEALTRKKEHSPSDGIVFTVGILLYSLRID